MLLGPGAARLHLDVIAVDLAPTVPSELREPARGLLLYGWFYYAIYAIGEHELRRGADAAVPHRYQQVGGPPNEKPGPEGRGWHPAEALHVFELLAG